jgi:hypothetical protein
MGLHGLSGPSEISVAQRFSDIAVLIHDCFHSLPIANHRFADHPHLTIA